MKRRYGRLVVAAVFMLGVCGIALSQGKAQGQPSDLATGLGKEFASETATVNGISLHYVRGGKGPAVILIHGFPQDWFEYIERSCRDWRSSSRSLLWICAASVGRRQQQVDMTQPTWPRIFTSSYRRLNWSTCSSSATTLVGTWPTRSFDVTRKSPAEL